MQKLFATNTKSCIIVVYRATFFLATIICYKYKNDLPQIQKIVLQLVIVQLPSWPPLFASNTKIICHKYKKLYYSWLSCNFVPGHLYLLFATYIKIICKYKYKTLYYGWLSCNFFRGHLYLPHDDDGVDSLVANTHTLHKNWFNHQTQIDSDIFAFTFWCQQDHLRMNVAPNLNNHLQAMDLFKSMIIKKIDQKFVIVIG